MYNEVDSLNQPVSPNIMSPAVRTSWFTVRLHCCAVIGGYTSRRQSGPTPSSPCDEGPERGGRSRESL